MVGIELHMVKKNNFPLTKRNQYNREKVNVVFIKSNKYYFIT